MTLLEIYLLSVALGGIGVLIGCHLDRVEGLEVDSPFFCVFLMTCPVINMAVFVAVLLTKPIEILLEGIPLIGKKLSKALSKEIF